MFSSSLLVTANISVFILASITSATYAKARDILRQRIQDDTTTFQCPPIIITTLASDLEFLGDGGQDSETPPYFFANPDNCGTYIECVPSTDGLVGTALPVVIYCPSETEWDEGEQTCGPMGKANCPSADGFRCPTKDMRAGCVGPKDCLYPNPESCLNYIQCVVDSDKIHGTPVVMPCPPSNPPLEWNAKMKSCDWASSSTCPRDSVQSREINRTGQGAWNERENRKVR